jgi:hypothetical protein
MNHKKLKEFVQSTNKFDTLTKTINLKAHVIEIDVSKSQHFGGSKYTNYIKREKRLNGFRNYRSYVMKKLR